MVNSVAFLRSWGIHLASHHGFFNTKSCHDERMISGYPVWLRNLSMWDLGFVRLKIALISWWTPMFILQLICALVQWSMGFSWLLVIPKMKLEILMLVIFGYDNSMFDHPHGCVIRLLAPAAHLLQISPKPSAGPGHASRISQVEA